MSIKIKLEGFDELLIKIQKAGGSIDNAADICMRKSAEIMESELKNQMQNANVSSRLINAMQPFKIEKDKNRFYAYVGYEKGEYNPKNITDGYKVLFLNYGTPHRMRHGKIKARGFIQKAKSKAKSKIKKQQEETLNQLLKEL